MTPISFGRDGTPNLPYSKGYFRPFKCCPDKKISVFQGSIFDQAVYPPKTIFKLLHYWACQIPSEYTVQWENVTKKNLKNFNTMFRSVCVAALHEKSCSIGGPGNSVEVGIIIVHCTSPKKCQVEILGVYDRATRRIRFKVIDSLNPTIVGAAAVEEDRIGQISRLLNHWIEKGSTILINETIERTFIKEIGFPNVIQTVESIPPDDTKSNLSNFNVMRYLRNIVPDMFQGNLCFLSKSLIQQFLDELSWREVWGRSELHAFKAILDHVAEVTQIETGGPVTSVLNKLSLNPFDERLGFDQLNLIDVLSDAMHDTPVVPCAPHASLRKASAMSSACKMKAGTSQQSNTGPSASSAATSQHFIHNGMDCVQCSLCLKVMMATSSADLELVEDHGKTSLKRSTKCEDCSLAFGDMSSVNSDKLSDKTHESRHSEPVIRRKLMKRAISKTVPPENEKAAASTATPLPSTKKAKNMHCRRNESDEMSNFGASGMCSTVKSLNAPFAVPINPKEKFTFQPFDCVVQGVDSTDVACYECGKAFGRHHHYRGRFKCNKCRFSTSCQTAINGHLDRIHAEERNAKDGIESKRFVHPNAEKSSCSCGFETEFPDDFASHMMHCELNKGRRCWVNNNYKMICVDE